MSGEYAMPTRQNDQEQPVDDQLIDEQSADEPSVDAIALLKEDHQRVKDLFAQFEAANNAEAKWRLAEEAFVELETHAQLEENIFYPAVNEETEEGPELVKESLSEHAMVKQLIQALRQMGPHSQEFDAKFHELMHNVEHHVEEEEAEMFPLAEEELAEDLDEMSAEMQELKKEILAS
jgi:hemerythrin-like domain-containing protein